MAIKKGILLRQLSIALKESLQSVLPIFAIVLLLSITLVPMNSGVLVLFLFGTLTMIVGMSFFTIGSDISMAPLGDGLGTQIGKARKLGFPILVCFLLGVITTVAEPDLLVIAEQAPSIPTLVLILCVAVGVGVFLVVAMLRTRKGLALNKLLILFYAAALILSLFVPADFIPTAFDAGGVTAGPITTPFLMALGTGMAAMSSKKNTQDNSFGMVSLLSIGPILSVLILAICFQPEAQTSESVVYAAETTADAFRTFTGILPQYMKEVLIAFLPIAAVLLIYQLIFRRFHKHQMLKMIVGFVYTYIGLVLFLAGANVGFMPTGKLIGTEIALGSKKYWLIPVGMLLGYFAVSAEPAVHPLGKQVEEVTNGAISQNSLKKALSVGVAISVGISILRVLTGIPLYPFLIIGYTGSLVISFFVPPVYTGVAFDSGGVASGTMTTTFMLPFAIGACEAHGGNVLTDAFGLVAMVALAPLITIQLMGFHSKLKHKKLLKKAHSELTAISDDILYFEEAEA